MGTTYDPATDAGKVRLLIRDTDDTDALFSDEEIAVFLELSGDNVLTAAALGLETIAADETLVQKRMTLLNLQTDGPAEALQLRQLARVWRQQATAHKTTVAFATAELVGYDLFAWAEKMKNEWLRES